MQMYKVFINDNPIIFTENNNISTKLIVKNFENVDIIELVNELFVLKNNGVCLICKDLKTCWKEFKSNFKIQKAAGGKVLNQKNETLFIYRFDRWDLPKGKLEQGETISQCAIREVEEECGVSELTIEEKLKTTYHIFQRKGKTILKISHWFLMKTEFNGTLIPQEEEGIEKVAFKKENEIEEALNNTYGNIKLLF